jgi:hypothetical protein
MIPNVHMIGRSKMNDRLPDMILNVHMIGRSKMNDRLPDMILNVHMMKNCTIHVFQCSIKTRLLLICVNCHFGHMQKNKKIV